MLVAPLSLLALAMAHIFDASRMSPVISATGHLPVVLRRPAAVVTVSLVDDTSQRCTLRSSSAKASD